MSNITLTKFLTQIKLNNTWIQETTFLKLNDDMFRFVVYKQHRLVNKLNK